MKKRISLLLALLMLLSLCVTASAEGESMEFPDESAAYAACGVAFTLPEEMRNLKGVLTHENTSIVDGVFCLDLFYFGMPRERYEELAQKVLADQQGTAEELEEYFTNGCSICSVYCVDGGRDFSAVTDAYRELLGADPGLDGENAAELARIGEYGFYLYKTHEPTQAAELTGDGYAEELERVLSGVDALVEGMVFTRPAPSLAVKYAPAVKMLEQINGAALALEEESEAAEPVPAEEAAVEAAAEEAEIEAAFVEEEAAPIEEPAVEAAVEEAETEAASVEEEAEPAEEPAVEAAAEEAEIAPVSEEKTSSEEPAPAEENAASEEAPGAVPNNLKTYRIFVKDDAGPVEGATVQFCSDTACLIGKTNADGCASFDQPAGVVYTVHILKTPKGYEKDKTEYETLNVYSDLEITITKTSE